MRTTFAKTLLALAKKDKRIMLLTGDLGYSVFEDFQKEVPRQYLNMGVAEQNMAGVAAGMAMEGLKPIIYSIVPFTTMRNFEQIRNDICYQNLDVKIVGVGAGFSYGPYGHTHHGLEDIGILRTLPNLVILTPGDPVEVKLATTAMMKLKGPAYLRIGKAGEPILHKKIPEFAIGKGIVMKEGNDVTIIATSTMLGRAMEVSQELEKFVLLGSQRKLRSVFRASREEAVSAHGVRSARMEAGLNFFGSPATSFIRSRERAVVQDHISVRVVSMPTIKPLDEKIILDSMKKTKVLVTLEEHSVIGGLGSAVAEVVAESGIPVKFKRIAVPDRFTKVIGLQEYMRKANGLSVDQIADTIHKLFI